MNVFQLVLFLHITLIIAAIAVAYGGGLVLRMAYMTGQVTAVRGVGMSLARTAKWIPVLFISAGIFGLLAAITGPYNTNLLAPWLIIAYVLFIIAMGLGTAITAPEGQRLGALLMKTPDGPIPPEVAAFFTGRALWITIIDYVIVAVLVFDMVVKPFS